MDMRPSISTFPSRAHLSLPARKSELLYVDFVLSLFIHNIFITIFVYCFKFPIISEETVTSDVEAFRCRWRKINGYLDGPGFSRAKLCL